MSFEEIREILTRQIARLGNAVINDEIVKDFGRISIKFVFGKHSRKILNAWAHQRLLLVNDLTVLCLCKG